MHPYFEWGAAKNKMKSDYRRTIMEAYEKRGYLDHEFRLFHLSDPVAEEISYHYHDFDKVIILINGSLDYIIEGKTYRLAPYDIILINHHAIHKPVISPGAPYERIIIYLSPSYIASCQTEAYDLNLCFQKAKKRCSDVLRIGPLKTSSLFQSITRLEQACQDDGYAKELYCRLLFLEFMVHLNRAAKQETLTYVSTSPNNEKVLEIMRYLYENPAADYTIDQLASRFYLSKYHMMRLFKQETGYTISNYICEKRLLMAKELLSQKLPITEVCYQCGFKNYAAFLRAYKKMFGELPSHYKTIPKSQ